MNELRDYARSVLEIAERQGLSSDPAIVALRHAITSKHLLDLHLTRIAIDLPQCMPGAAEYVG